MHPSIRLLEDVVRLTEEEFGLLELEDAEGLTESAARRGELLREAWEEKAGCDQDLFADLLGRIQELQYQLDALAREKLAETRDALNERKKSQAAILGYCKIGAGYGRPRHQIFTKFS